jgi:hypothetical protein
MTLTWYYWQFIHPNFVNMHWHTMQDTPLPFGMFSLLVMLVINTAPLTQGMTLTWYYWQFIHPNFVNKHLHTMQDTPLLFRMFSLLVMLVMDTAPLPWMSGMYTTHHHSFGHYTSCIPVVWFLVIGCSSILDDQYYLYDRLSRIQHSFCWFCLASIWCKYIINSRGTTYMQHPMLHYCCVRFVFSVPFMIVQLGTNSACNLLCLHRHVCQQVMSIMLQNTHAVYNAPLLLCMFVFQCTIHDCQHHHTCWGINPSCICPMFFNWSLGCLMFFCVYV